jgi:hypothetical protein
MPQKPKPALKITPVSENPDIKKKLGVLVEKLSPEALTADLDAETNMLAETIDDILRENGCLEPADRAGDPLLPTTTKIADIAHCGILNRKTRKLN